MKRNIIAAIVALLIITAAWLTPSARYYAKSARVTQITGDLVVLIDGAGVQWSFWGPEDWCVGDVADLLMYDNMTPGTIYDDRIVKAHYAGNLQR